MFARNLYLCVFLLVQSSLVAMGETLAVRIDSDAQDVWSSEPIEVQVSVRNIGEGPITMAPLSVLGDNPNLVFHVVTAAQTNRISKPVLVLEQAEGNCQLKRINVSPGQIISERFVIGVDWDSEEPIFLIGTNWLFCTVITIDGDEVQSDKQHVVVHVPQKQNEIEVQSLIDDRDTLRSLYAPNYLLLVKQPEKVVTAMRRIALIDQGMAKRAGQALSDWKKYEKDAREGRAPGLKAKGFDKLGLNNIP